MSDDKRDEGECGALWEQTNARGTYLSGTINGVRVVAFKNDKKIAGDKQPIYRVLKAKARDEDTGPRVAMALLEDEEPPF